MPLSTSAKRTVTLTNPPVSTRASGDCRERRPSQGANLQRQSRVDAASILELLTLGAPQGSSLVLTAKGPDAEQALDAVVQELSKHYE